MTKASSALVRTVKRHAVCYFVSRMFRYLMIFLILSLHLTVWADERLPFSEACGSTSTKDRPATGLLVRSYPRGDTHGRQTSNFLGAVLQAASDKLDSDLTFTKNILDCHSDPYENLEKCRELKEFVSLYLPQVIRDARFHLSVAQSPQALMSVFEQTNTIPNDKMTTTGLAKLRPWSSLTPEENSRARQVLRDYQKEIFEHYRALWGNLNGDPVQRQTLTQSLLKVRVDHFAQYRTYMVAVPFLQYFEGPNPSRAQTLNYFRDFQVNAEKEKTYLAKLQTRLQAPMTEAELDEVIGVTLQYSSYVDLLLEKNPEYCGLAASLIYTQMNREIGTGLAVGIPLLAASFVAPPLASYSLGIAASGYFAYESYQRYQRTRDRVATVLMLESNNNSDADLWNSRDQLAGEVLLFPLSFVGGRFAVKGLRSFWTSRLTSQSSLRGHVYLPRIFEATYQKFSRPI